LKKADVRINNKAMEKLGIGVADQQNKNHRSSTSLGMKLQVLVQCVVYEYSA
jgi:hypothetical protein